MGQAYEISDLQEWDRKIREKVEAFGLNCYPQEFEVCDHFQMLNYISYSGMPAHYPHWSYGKSYEKQKTLYDYGVSGLPYEMVINANPSIAYLMRDNTLALQVLTIAHVYGHNDFFKNNFTFRHTEADKVVARFKLHADRIRDYSEDPSIGEDAVEEILDAAHALSLQRSPNIAVKRRSVEEQRSRMEAESHPRKDPFQSIHKREVKPAPDYRRMPPEPDPNVLLFIRDNNPNLSEWQKDILTIVDTQAQYFIPQIETKIMNEGWASFWHREIMNSLGLPQDIKLEFLVRHNQVVCPHPGGVNPYHVGLKIWDDIRRRYDNPTQEEIARDGPPNKSGMEKLFEVRETDRDASFLRRFLTEELMREMNMFQHEEIGGERVVTKVADEQEWRTVKEHLIKNTGTGSIPVIKVLDADFGGRRTLCLVHEHEGRDLELEYAEKTLGYLYTLWGHDVCLKTQINSEPKLLCFEEEGLKLRKD